MKKLFALLLLSTYAAGQTTIVVTPPTPIQVTVQPVSSNAVQLTVQPTINGTGSSGAGGTSDHGLLTGLTDDDHPQYFNQSRGDSRYLRTESDPFFGANFAAAIAAYDTRTVADGRNDTRYRSINYVPSWTEITGKPSTFAPSAHAHDDRYFTEAESDNRYLQSFTESDPVAAVHAARIDNPHGVTKGQVGLPLVPNVDATNPANITQSATYRFATDAEKTTWNAKQAALGYTAENAVNKATNLSSPDNTKYPTVQATVNALAPKADSTYTYPKSTLSGWFAGKVDKVTGKGLSPEEFSSAEKTKLSGVAPGATAYGDANARASISLTTTGSGAATYNPSTGAFNIPTPSGGGTLDATPTNGSTNGVESNGVFDELAGKAAASHTHPLSEITGDGTAAALDVAPSGDASASQVVKGSDSRLTNARTPTTHTHNLADISDEGTAAGLNVAASGDAASGEVVKGNDTRLSDARTPVAHNQAFSTITATPTTLSGYGITDAQGLDADLTDLSDGTLSGSKIGTGINGDNITTGTVAAARVATLNQNTTGSAASFTGNLAGDATGTQGAVVVGKVNGVAFSGLATGILKNTTTTGVPSIAVAGDFPTLNQSTTGSAASLTTARAIYGNSFDGSAALAQVIASTFGGTGNGFTKFSGPTTSEKTFTLPNASATVLTDNAAVTVAQGGTGSGTAAGARTNLGLGTSSTLNIPASGNAASGEVVKGDDSRLSDTRTPTDGTVSTAKLADDAVTNAKGANMAQNRVKGRVTASTGDPEDLTPDNLVTILNGASTALNTTVAPGSGGGSGGSTFFTSSADQTGIVSSATNLTSLVTGTLAANTTHVLRGTVYALTTATTTGLLLNFSLPSGATIIGEATLYLGTAASGNLTGYIVNGSAFGTSAAWPTANSVRPFRFEVTVTISSTAGAVQVQAQRNGGAGTVTVKAGSFLELVN